MDSLSTAKMTSLGGGMERVRLDRMMGRLMEAGGQAMGMRRIAGVADSAGYV
jgi:hypothetical protein